MTESTTPAFGVLLVNLGTPDRPDAAAVRAYLAEFLWDKRVIRMPRLLWWLILHGIILRVRPRKAARLYQSIWTPDGSPLLAFSRRQQQALQKALQEQTGTIIPVELAMTYGNPGLPQALDRFENQGIQRILVLPLFPQHSATTSAAAFDAIARALQDRPHLPGLHFIRDYCHEPAYLDALAASVRRHWDKHGMPDRLLLSFHGIPQRYEDQGDPYPGLCRDTAQGVAQRLGLTDHQWRASFQSRFGREEWVKPYTDQLLQEWGAQEGINRVDVICPAFAVDCLETLEEIAVQNRNLFLSAGGKEYHYIPCLNDNPEQIALFAALVQRHSLPWR